MKLCSALIPAALLTGCAALTGLVAGSPPGLPATGGPASGGSASVSFTNDQGSNRDTSPYSATKLSGMASYFPTIGPISAFWTLSIWIFAASATEPGPVVKERNIEVEVEGQKPAPGVSYPLDEAPSSVFYEETVSTASGSGKVWQSNGGTLTIQSLAGSTLVFSISGATMAVAASGSLPGISTNRAVGTFTLSATGSLSNFVLGQ